MLGRNRLGFATLVAALALALGLAGAGAVPAVAAPSAHGVVGTGVSVRFSIPASQGLSVHPNINIFCSAQISSPVFSNGVVIVTGQVLCDHPVTSLKLEVDLYANNLPWGGAGTANGTTAVAAAATGVCIPGTWPYFGRMILQTVWPAPVVGAPIYTATSGLTNIDC